MSEKKTVWNQLGGKFETEAASMGSDLKEFGTMGAFGVMQAGFQVATQISDEVRAGKDWNAGIPTATEDADGKPSYNLGQSREALNSMDPNDFGKGLGLSGAMQGAGAMAATGNPLLMAGGALVGGIAGALGRRKAKREAEKSKREEMSKFNDAQLNFNEDLASYDNQQDVEAQQRAYEEKRYERLMAIV